MPAASGGIQALSAASAPTGGGLFDTPVTVLRGVSAKRKAQLAKLNIQTVFDLISHFPRDYEDWTDLRPLKDLREGEEMAFEARVARQPSLTRKGRLSMLRTVLRDEESAIKAIWFNQPYLADQLVKDETYIFRGKVRIKGLDVTVQNPSFEKKLPDSTTAPRIRARYRLTAGLSQGVIRGFIEQALKLLLGHLPEPLPDEIRREHQLTAIDFAYSRIHNPASLAEAELCRRRLAFEELFLIQAGLRLLRRRSALAATAPPINLTAAQRQAFRDAVHGLPFKLTTAQKKAVNEVVADLNRAQPMNRLVQGDVGSGKTVVAALALLTTALAGYQGVMMAPTSILAAQHFATLTQLLGLVLQQAGLEIALLTGSVRAAERRRILAGLTDGSIAILIGTHAVIEDKVRFRNLALAVTDEQHRFGVRQRTLLATGAAPLAAENSETAAATAAAGTIQPPSAAATASEASAGTVQPPSAHVLVMSATPIPRTLALILYGDLDLSIIHEKPAGRQPIKTYTATSRDRARLDKLLRREVEAGGKCYVVCPQIEETEETAGAANGVLSAEAAYARLQQTLPDLKLGLLHGSLKAKEKQTVMDGFMDSEVDILVATTVIEVGVDQPRANLMIIENAERFGLSQLHQLRGRIGRGNQPSLCVLVSDVGEGVARERLRTLCHSDDGFLLAEKDLELRGPGDFFGTRQHGLPDFHAANLYQDTRLLKEVQTAVDNILAADPDLNTPPNRRVIQALQSRYQEVFPNIGL